MDSSPKSPGQAQRIIVAEDYELINNQHELLVTNERSLKKMKDDEQIVVVVDEQDQDHDHEYQTQESPFVRADYMRRSFSLPDIANIKNSVMMNHQMIDFDEQHQMNRITFKQVEFISGGTGNHSDSRMPHKQSLAYISPKLSQSWFGGVFGCFRPIIGILSSKGFKDNKTNSWEIPYESLRDMEYLGCGAQGSVYVGEYIFIITL